MNVIDMKYTLMLLMVLSSVFSFGQSVRIYGYITDVKTGERLIGSTVYDAKARGGTASNSYGFYSLQVEKGDTVELIYSFVGYENIKKRVCATETKEMNVALVPGKTLGEVVVKTSKVNAEISTHTLNMQKMKRLPAVGGEVDLIKAVQLLPGAQSGNEGKSGLYVRGGGPDQNLVLLDGIPLYYADHLGGFVSVFNPDAIKSVSLIKGGFPAQYGNRLSSVLDVRMNDGSLKKFKGQATLGVLATKLCVEGPLVKDTSSFIVSFRRFMYDLFSRPVTALAFKGITLGYTFYDLNMKGNYIFSKKDRIYLSSYVGDDIFSIRMKRKDEGGTKTKTKMNWGNVVASMRWNHMYSSTLFSNTSLYFSRYRYKTAEQFSKGDEYFYDGYYSGIEDVGVRFEFEFTPSQKYKMLWGANVVRHRFKPSILTIEQKIGVNENNEMLSAGILPALESSAYIENRIKLFQNVNVNAGLRVSNYAIQDTAYLSLEPRFLAKIQLPHKQSVSVAYAAMQQNVNVITAGLDMPVDYWLPATQNIAPSYSQQLSVAYSLPVFRQKAFLTVEGFYKKMDNLISLAGGSYGLGAGDEWEQEIETGGNGGAYGIEFLVEKKFGDYTGWVGYTLSKTERQFPDQNNGEKFPFTFDRRNDISAVCSYQINEHIDISATWVYGTGNATTLAVGHHQIINDNSVGSGYDGDFQLEEALIYGDKNSFRMRDYHRLDVGVNFKKKKQKGERVWNVSVYNLYCRNNPYYYFWDYERIYDSRGEVSHVESTLKQLTLFPFVPSVSYSFTF